MLDVDHLCKTFGDRVAVEDVSLSLKPGEIVGLLGPNGAGKTTTVSMITGLVAPTRGHVLLGGVPVRGDQSPAKRRIGLVPQELALFDRLTALDNVRTFGALYGVPASQLERNAAAALELVGLADRAREAPAKFSGGMKRRLNLACALVHDPEVLLLDEPTVGVDPQSRNAIFDNLEALRGQGKALLYTTHYMEEAERLCDRVVIMDAGKVIADDALGLLKVRQSQSATVELTLDRPPGAALVDQGRGRWTLVGDAVLQVGMASLEHELPALLSALTASGFRVLNIHSSRASLETLFLELTGRRLRDE